MATDEDKCKIAKLLQGLEVPETKLSERCNDMIREFHKKFDGDMSIEEMEAANYENPYVPDKELLEENERKLKELLMEGKRAKKTIDLNLNAVDPKRPWRTHSNKEKLLRIENELKQHIEKSSSAITPMDEQQMSELVNECREEALISRPVGANRMRDTVEEARRSLPNFQYRSVENSTATTILPQAHGIDTTTSTAEDGQYIDRPDSGQCFLRCLGELRNLRVLALEYAHIADGSGYALLSLLPVIRRPHFRLQLICREDQIPGRADAALGVGGHDIPDTAWRRVAIACPDLYLFMAFYRIRDYDNVRRFLTPSIPLRETHLQLGIDLNVSQRQDSDFSCFIRHLGYRYARTLVTLSIQQWRTVEVPMRRILELMPRLTRLQYTGRVSVADVHDALTIVSCGVCEKLKQIKIQIQDEESKRTYWKKEVEKLTDQFKNIMELYEITFIINIYKS